MIDFPSEGGKPANRGSFNRRPVWLRAGLSQLLGILAGILVYEIWVLVPGSEPHFALVVAAVGIAAAAAGTACFNLPNWWLPINLLFPLGLWIGVIGEWPGWIFGALFGATLLVFWNVVRDRVPLYLSNRTTSNAVAKILRELRPAATGDIQVLGQALPHAGRFCDLGSGTGGFALRVAAACPRWQVVGFESAPVLLITSVVRSALQSRVSCTFARRNFWEQSLSGFDVVYAFLSPEPMPRLLEKARSEMAPGSVFISNSFDVPGEEPDEIIELSDSRSTRLLIWRF